MMTSLNRLRRCYCTASKESIAHLQRFTPSGNIRFDARLPGAPEVAMLTLENAAKRNSVSPHMMLQLLSTLENLHRQLNETTTRALVLTGSGSSFCAGADLQSQGDSDFLSKETGEAMSEVMIAATAMIEALPIITVAALNGPAVGGGAELASSTDFRVMSSNSFIQYVHVTRGVTPGWGGTQRLVELTGRRNALYLLASAIRLPAEGCAQFQLVDAIVDPTESTSLLDHTLEFLRPLLHRNDSGVSAESLRAIKRAVNGSSVHSDGRYKNEAAVFREVWGGQQQRAFMDKWKK